MNAVTSFEQAQNIHISSRAHPNMDPARIADLYQKQVSIEEIAVEIGVGLSTLKNFLRKNRESFPKREKGKGKVGVLTPEDLQRASKMWISGVELREIAGYFGVTRNVIIGKAKTNRDMFPLRRAPNRPKEERSERRPRKKSVNRNWNTNLFGYSATTLPRDPEYFARSTEYDAERLMVAKPLQELSSCECKWPLNEGGPFLFCAAETSRSRAYCDHHEARS